MLTKSRPVLELDTLSLLDVNHPEENKTRLARAVLGEFDRFLISFSSIYFTRQGVVAALPALNR